MHAWHIGGNDSIYAANYSNEAAVRGTTPESPPNMGLLRLQWTWRWLSTANGRPAD